MKTWRERIVEARVRGWFTDDDRQAASSYTTCKVGEEGRRAGLYILRELVEFSERMAAPLRPHNWECDGILFWKAVCVNDFNEADRLADAIEDRALQLKREATP